MPTPSMPRAAALVAMLVLAACAPQQPLTITPPAEKATAPVVRRPLPEAPAGTPTPAPGAPGPLAGIRVPPGLLYVCVTDVEGELTQVGIEFAPKVHALCARHPEMGPCQYERNACRRSGGRVFAANGDEITMATEAEYDRKVLRARFRAN